MVLCYNNSNKCNRFQGGYMKEYQTSNIRNVAILGHQGSGKTTMAEAILYVSGAVDKQGEVDKKHRYQTF